MSYVTIKFGENEELLCNPMCSVVNLMTNIKQRAGYGDQTAMVVELSDDTGLVKELDNAKSDQADKHLQPLKTYILLEKQTTSADSLDTTSSGNEQVKYVPLLSNPQKLFPNFNIKIAETETTKVKKKKRHPVDASSPGAPRSNSKRSTSKNRATSNSRAAKK